MTDIDPSLLTDKECELLEAARANANGTLAVRSNDVGSLIEEIAHLRGERDEYARLAEQRMFARDRAEAERDALREALMDSDRVARLFHQTYERLAPSFGYHTRKESAVLWANVPEQNRALMIATAAEVARALISPEKPTTEHNE